METKAKLESVLLRWREMALDKKRKEMAKTGVEDSGKALEPWKRKEPERFSHAVTPKGIETVPHETVLHEFVHCKGHKVYSRYRLRQWSQKTPGPWCTKCEAWAREPAAEGWVATGRKIQLAYKGMETDYYHDRLRLFK